MIPALLELLRRLAINDEHALSRVLDGQATSSALLDDKASALVRVATLVALEADVSSYQWAIDGALAADADDAEIIDVLLAVAPIVGVARVNAAALALAAALDYDLEYQP